MGTAAGKDEVTIGAHLGPGEEFHPAAWTGEYEFQATRGAAFGVICDCRTAARA